jgi:hypothetical protein
MAGEPELPRLREVGVASDMQMATSGCGCLTLMDAPSRMGGCVCVCRRFRARPDDLPYLP